VTQGLRVLVVHDDEGTQRFLARVLRRLGHDMRSAWAKWQAVELIHRESFDAAVLDVHLPDGLGIDLVRPFKVRNSSARVLVVSGYPCRKAAQLSIEAGATFAAYAADQVERFLDGAPLEASETPAPAGGPPADSKRRRSSTSQVQTLHRLLKKS
jgi:ActR/RegA family two-component response regulator